MACMENTTIKILQPSALKDIGPCQDLRDEPFAYRIREQVFVACLPYRLEPQFLVSTPARPFYAGSRYGIRLEHEPRICITPNYVLSDRDDTSSCSRVHRTDFCLCGFHGSLVSSSRQPIYVTHQLLRSLSESIVRSIPAFGVTSPLNTYLIDHRPVT
ncbi:hypothetical protein DPSP01_013506 [Paraphaeosphaeria sporulosa]